MPKIPPSQQSSLIAYFDFLQRNVDSERSRKIEGIKNKAFNQGMTNNYSKDNINILESVQGGRSVAGVIKKNRYDDLFETLISYSQVSNTRTPEELQENLTKLFGSTGKANAETNAERLSRELLRTPSAESFFTDTLVEKIQPARVGLFSNIVKEKKRDKLTPLSKQGKLYKVFDEKRKENRLIFEDRISFTRNDKKFERTVFRDVRTGRFSKNPESFRKEIKQRMR